MSFSPPTSKNQRKTNGTIFYRIIISYPPTNLAVIDTGSSASGKANVDVNFNLQTNMPGNKADGSTQGGGNTAAGGAVLLTEQDSGATSGVRQVLAPQSSQDRRLRVGSDMILMNETFNGNTQNTSKWAYTAVTLTASQPGAGTLNFGTVQGTAVTHGAFMRSFQYFPLIGSAPLVAEFSVGQFTAAMIANEEWYCGFALPTTAGTAPTDGVWFKLTTSGLVGEIKYNNSLTSTASLATLASFTVGTQFRLKIIVGEDEVSFWRDGVRLGALAIPVADGQPIIMASLPVFMQKLCTGSVSNTNTMRVGDIHVFLSDLDFSKPWPHQMATLGQSGYLGQDGHTQGKTTLWTNSTAPTAAALTNTAAAFTGLGGIVAVLPTLTANADGKLITYQNPASSINITGRNLVITGISIQGAVSVVLVGGPVTYAYALAYGHTATSLATGESASFGSPTTHAPRILPLGIDTYPVTAAAGTLGTPVIANFDTPVIVRPGEFLDIVARNIGTVTTTGAITCIIRIEAYWE